MEKSSLFIRKLLEDEGFRSALAEATQTAVTKEERIVATTKYANEAGFDVSADELQKFVENMLSASNQLSDSDLDNIAGGQTVEFGIGFGGSGGVIGGNIGGNIGGYNGGNIFGGSGGGSGGQITGGLFGGTPGGIPGGSSGGSSGGSGGGTISLPGGEVIVLPTFSGW